MSAAILYRFKISESDLSGSFLIINNMLIFSILVLTNYNLGGILIDVSTRTLRVLKREGARKK